MGRVNYNHIPRKHRKEATKLIEEFKRSNLIDNDFFINWKTFLEWNQLGANDGWLEYTDRKYQALQWLRHITDMVNELNFHEARKALEG